MKYTGFQLLCTDWVDLAFIQALLCHILFLKKSWSVLNLKGSAKSFGVVFHLSSSIPRNKKPIQLQYPPPKSDTSMDKSVVPHL